MSKRRVQLKLVVNIVSFQIDVNAIIFSQMRVPINGFIQISSLKKKDLTDDFLKILLCLT